MKSKELSPARHSVLLKMGIFRQIVNVCDFGDILQESATIAVGD
jgi:hypothetical protein